MSTYTYPKGQDLYNNTVFIMRETFYSGLYIRYKVPVNINKEIAYHVRFSHENIAEYIKKTPSAVLTQDNIAHGRPIIKLPLSVGTTLS